MSSTIIVDEALRKENYEIWKESIKCYLESQDLWDVVEDSCTEPVVTKKKKKKKSTQEEANMKELRRKNAAALHAIKISCSLDLLFQIRDKTNAKDAWDALATLCRRTIKKYKIKPATSVNPSNFGVPTLEKDNYEMWKGCMKSFLSAQSLWQVVVGKTVSEENDELRKKNEEALQAIRIACGPDLLEEIKENTTAKDAWDALATLCKPIATIPTTDVSTVASVNLRKLGVATLRKDNYELWRACMEPYLEDQDLWQIVVSKNVSEETEDWRKKNKEALNAIRDQCSPDLLEQIKDKTKAKDAWDTLAAFFKPPTSQTEGHGVERAQALTLFKAIHNNDLDFVKRFFQEHPDLISARFELNCKGMALHHATVAESLNIVEELIGKISDEDVKKDDGYGTSALSFAAKTSGMRSIRIAERLIRKNNQSLIFPDDQGRIPLTTACYVGNKNMTYYLYSLTPRQFLASEDGTYQAADFLCYCIANNMFDIALDILRLYPHLTLVRLSSPKLVLSFQLHAFPSGSKLNFWQQWIYSVLKVNPPTASNVVNVGSLPSSHDQSEITKIVNQEKLRLGGPSSIQSYFLRFSGIKRIYDVKMTHVYAHQLLLMMSKTISTLNFSQTYQSDLVQTIFMAARLGITEFLVEVVRANPDFLFAYDGNGRNIFQIAVVHRQEKVFSLIYSVGALRSILSSFQDLNDDCLLHLVGHLPPQSMLDQISGAALQMQRELQWFKEIESIVPEVYRGYKNTNGKTPYELFEENHKELVTEGEKWMKGIAQSSTVVGALIITMIFAALYTVPGGNNQNTGIPLLLGNNKNNKALKVFIVSDAISLFASSTSVLMFLGILTSRYAPEDFLKSLPTKLIIALSSLFISIAAMMVAFSATVIIMLKGKLSFVIPIIFLASVPVSLFVWLQSPLLMSLFLSTYGPGIFDRKMKKWI